MSIPGVGNVIPLNGNINLSGFSGGINGQGINPGGSNGLGYIPPSSSPSTSVLGASTSPPPATKTPPPTGNNGGQQKQNGGWYNGVQYWAPGQGPQAATTGGQPSNSDLPTIDSLYSGQMDFLNGLKPELESDKSAALGVANTQYQGQKQTVADQLNSLKQQLGIDTGNFGQNMNSAYSQAQKDYNQLLQRNLALYGGQGVGQAIAAILGQGYQEQTGQLRNTDLSGHQALDKQAADQTMWGNQQNNQLDTWKAQADNTINLQFQQGMDAINQQIGMTNDAKAQAKLGLLQQVIQQRQALDTYHVQLQNQMAMIQAMNNPSQFGLSGPLDQSQYQQQMATILGQASQIPSQLQQNILGSAGVNPQVANGLGFGAGYVPTSQTGTNTNDILSKIYGQQGAFGV